MKKYVEQVTTESPPRSLQEIRYHRRNRRINFFLMCLVLGSLGFLLSPWSQICEVYIEGNHYYSREEIMEILGIPHDGHVLSVFSRLSEVAKLPLVKSSSFSWVFPRKLTVRIKERSIHGYGVNEEGFFLMTPKRNYVARMERDRQLLTKLPFVNIDEVDLVHKTSQHLATLKPEFLTLISEIKMYSRGHHPEMIEIMMNDGNRLFMKIDQLALIKKYPSILENLQGEQRCIYFNVLTNTAVASDCTEEKSDENGK